MSFTTYEEYAAHWAGLKWWSNQGAYITDDGVIVRPAVSYTLEDKLREEIANGDC